MFFCFRALSTQDMCALQSFIIMLMRRTKVSDCNNLLQETIKSALEEERNHQQEANKQATVKSREATEVYNTEQKRVRETNVFIYYNLVKT